MAKVLTLLATHPGWALVCCLLFFAPLLITCHWLWRIGHAARLSETFPPAGTKTFGRRAPLTGAAAALRGRALQALSAVLACLSLLAAIVLWGLIVSFGDSDSEPTQSAMLTRRM